MSDFNTAFAGKVALVTGHTGFKGSWLSAWLNQLGAKVVGVSINIPTEPSNYDVSCIHKIVEDHRIDIRDSVALKSIVKKIEPDFVFHLAAQALVRASYDDPLNTLSTNAIGTACVLDSLRSMNKPVAAVMITSDKAYDNVEWVWGYREKDRLGGKDPYSASKGMAELAIRTYVKSFFTKEKSKIRVGIGRAGNVIGGGDWAKDRIVSDCMRSWSQGTSVDIRSPDATRPWQHVMEPLSGYLALASSLSETDENHGEAYNFGPSANQNHSVRELIEEMAKYWVGIQWNDISRVQKHLHEANLLKLNCDKAHLKLNWKPNLDFKDTVRMTAEWYKNYYDGNKNSSMFEFTVGQIETFTKVARSKNLAWACHD